MRVNIPFRSECPKCKAQCTWNIRLGEYEQIVKCRCGHSHSETFQSDITIGWMVLQKSRWELDENEDGSMCIVLAAMALECELARLFRKALRVEAPGFPEAEFEEKLRGLGNAQRKIETICKKMYPEGIDAFVGNTPDLKGEIISDFPGLYGCPLAAGIQKAVFWPRNAILHGGDAKHDREEPVYVFCVAQLGLQILQRLEFAKWGCVGDPIACAP
jgi:hypothetical protein